MPNADFNNQIRQLKSKLIQISCKAISCGAEERRENFKLKNAMATENEEEVLIYTVSTKQKHAERMAYLRLKNSLQHSIDRLEFLATGSEINQSVRRLTNSLESSLESALATGNYQATFEAVDSIDKLEEKMAKDELNRSSPQVADHLHPAFPIEPQQLTDVKCSKEVTEKLMAELKKFQKDPPDSCSAGLVDKDIFHWQGIILGPEESPYAGGSFLVDLHCSPDYPSRPPKVSFKTKVFHPNIDHYGTIGLDILKEKWSPDLSISRVLLSIFSLLADPNFDDPLVPENARMYKTDRVKFETIAQSWTHQYAMG